MVTDAKSDSPKVFLVVIALVAVAIRMVDVNLNLWNVSLGQSDSLYYYAQADLLAHGHGFIDPFAFGYGIGVRSSAAHPPLFTLILAGADLARHWSVNETRLLCSGIGGVGVYMVGLLGREVGGHRVGLFAAGIAAGYPVWWITDGLVLSEVVYVPLAAGLLLLAYRLWERPRVATAVATGIVGGLAALTRSEGLLLLLVVATAVLCRNRAVARRRRAQLLVVTMVAGLLVIAPWIGYNLARFDHPVYMSTNNGATIADSNCPATYFGTSTGSYVFACHTPKINEVGDESNVSRLLVQVGVRYMRKHLTRVPLVAASRVGRVWGFYRPLQTVDLDAYGKWSHGDSELMLFSYYGVALASIIGAVVLRRRHITIVPMLAAVIAVTVVVAAFYGIIRFRVPGDVAFVVLAACAVDAAITGTRAALRRPGGGFTDRRRAALATGRS